MVQKSEFLTAIDEKKLRDQQGFGAPAPMESVVDTVGQAPAVQSPFGQQAGMDAISRDFEVDPYDTAENLVGSPRVLDAIAARNPEWSDDSRAAMNWDAAERRKDDARMRGPNPLAAPIDLAAAPAVQASQGQVPMLGGFEVRGAGKERFDLGTPEVPETLFSTEYTDPGGHNAAAQSRQIEAQSALQSAESERQRINKATQDRIDTRNEVGTNIPDLFKSAVPYIKEGIGMAQSAGEGVAEFVTGRDIEIPDAVDLRMYDATTAVEAAAEKQRLSDQMIPAPPSVDPFGVTSSEIAAAGNQNFGQAVSQAQPEDPYRTQYGVNSLDQGAVDEIQQQGAAAPQAQLPSTIQNAGGQNLAEFKPKYKGQSLTDFMAGRDDPSAASVQVQDPQGRFRRQAASVAGETPEQNQARTDALFPDQADFQQASADREARQAARPDFGEAQTRAAGTVTDAERRAARGDGMSDADRRDIAKANQRGASAGDVARGDKVAAANGIDRKTGKSLEGDGLTVEQQLAIRKQQFTESEAARKAKVENAGLVLTPGEKKIDEDVASDLNDWRLNGSSLAKSNIIQLSEVIGDLEDGNIDTRSLSDFAPMSDNVRALFNPTGQDALDKVRGVIFQSLKATLGGQFAEKEGIRLVNAAYNTQLSEEQNIDRLGALLRRTQAAADAKDNASQYFQENGTLKGYSGVGARSAFDASTGAQGAKGSPIKGDVDVAGEADSRLNKY